MNRLRIALWVVVGLAAIGLVLLWNQSSTQQSGSQSTIGSAIAPFTLTGSDGRPFPSSRLNGKPAAIFFGFTHCPDVCPTTLARLAKLRRQLGQGDDALSIVFVSVDPERDTPQAIDGYIKLFDTPVVGLTGTPAQLQQAKQRFGAYSRKVDRPGGGYDVEHTAAVMLMDRNGQFVATISPEEGDQAALDKLKRVTA